MTRQGDDMAPSTLWDRLWAKVDASGDCWIFTGAATTAGYGHLSRGDQRGKFVMAHRASWELLVGPIPEGMTLDHLCRVPLCVNPDHLEPVTQLENTLRGYGFAAEVRRRGKCQRGHPWIPENVYTNAVGANRCRPCMALKHRGWRKRAAA